jgi:hypothetical protein
LRTIFVYIYFKYPQKIECLIGDQLQPSTDRVHVSTAQFLTQGGCDEFIDTFRYEIKRKNPGAEGRAFGLLSPRRG